MDAVAAAGWGDGRVIVASFRGGLAPNTVTGVGVVAGGGGGGVVVEDLNPSSSSGWLSVSFLMVIPNTGEYLLLRRPQIILLFALIIRKSVPIIGWQWAMGNGVRRYRGKQECSSYW